MSDRSCSVNGTYFNSSDFGSMSECVPLNRCPTILNNPQAPIMETFPCGFDENSQLLMICCPTDLVRAPINFAQPPLFPTPRGKARTVEDKTGLCGKWRYEGGACELDRHFSTSGEEDPDIGRVTSREMFDFMQRSCAKTCGWVESGCHDEHPRCEDWARRGMCVTSGMFMAHTCRESCGVCGFLAPENKVRQEPSALNSNKSSSFNLGNTN